MAVQVTSWPPSEIKQVGLVCLPLPHQSLHPESHLGCCLAGSTTSAAPLTSSSAIPSSPAAASCSKRSAVLGGPGLGSERRLVHPLV